MNLPNALRYKSLVTPDSVPISTVIVSPVLNDMLADFGAAAVVQEKSVELIRSINEPALPLQIMLEITPSYSATNAVMVEVAA